jgi:phenylacetate-coenzyme A ligase PaaK-like adenylate-forming protein
MLSFDQLRSLVKHVTSKEANDFYPALYGRVAADGPLEIATIEEWQKLPFVTKDTLIARSLSERTFLPIGALDHLRSSSGTSGKPPLFSPRTHVRNMEYRLKYHDFKKPLLAFTVPMMPYWHERFQAENGGNPSVIAYDPKYPKASITLAKAAGVDAASLFAYHVQAAGEEMKRLGINEQMRLFEIAGETCSRALYNYMRATFPNAVLLHSYGAGEVEDVHMGMPCKPLDGTEPLSVYHPKSTHYLEIVDPGSGEVLEPAPGVEGDLIISAYPGEPSAFPLVRFRIGDTVRVVETSCKEHGLWSFTVLGRSEMDFAKIPGGGLGAEEIARVLRLFPNEVTDFFVLHCRNEETASGPLFKPVLEVETAAGTDLAALAEKISRELRVAPRFTYAQGVAQGRYLPLACAILQKSGISKKHLRIVRDQ